MTNDYTVPVRVSRLVSKRIPQTQHVINVVESKESPLGPQEICGSRRTSMDPSPFTAYTVVLLLAIVTVSSPLRVAAAVVVAVCLAVVSLLRRAE